MTDVYLLYKVFTNSLLQYIGVIAYNRFQNKKLVQFRRGEYIWASCGSCTM